jgi:hypothetical protein
MGFEGVGAALAVWVANAVRTATKATRMAARAGRCWDIGIKKHLSDP